MSDVQPDDGPTIDYVTRDELAAAVDTLHGVIDGLREDMAAESAAQLDVDLTQYATKDELDSVAARIIASVRELAAAVADSGPPPSSSAVNDGVTTHVIGELTPDVEDAIRQEQLAKHGGR